MLLRRRAGRRDGRRSGRQAEMGADALDDGGIVNELDVAHLVVALGANQNVMAKNALEQLGPRTPILRGRLRLRWELAGRDSAVSGSAVSGR
jgi:hypothetical protein